MENKNINKNRKKRLKQIAVIFKRDADKENEVTLFEPKKLVTGRYEEKGNYFYGDDGVTYPYLYNVTKKSKTGLGFALRTTVKELNQQYHKKTLRELSRVHIKQMKDYYYYFGCTADYRDLGFICQNKASGEIFNLDDKDCRQIVLVSPEEMASLKIDANKLATQVNDVVLGQEDAINDIVTVLWQNSKNKEKKNMILVGPTGVGKTKIVETIAQELNVPCVSINCTDLTKNGYVGDSVVDIVVKLVNKADNDIKKAEHGIVFLDEIDKLQANSHDEITTSGVQQELLKMVEGGDYEIDLSDNIYNPNIATINTKGITFIAGGAFSNLKTMKELDGKGIGFGSSLKDDKSLADVYRNIDSKDLIKYGIIDELAGRFPIVIPLNPLSKDILIQIMKNPKSNIFNSELNTLTSEGIALEMADSVYEKIAQRAMNKKIGARGLEGELTKLFVKAMGEISRHPNEYEKLIIDEETIDNPNHYSLVRKRNKK